MFCPCRPYTYFILAICFLLATPVHVFRTPHGNLPAYLKMTISLPALVASEQRLDLPMDSRRPSYSRSEINILICAVNPSSLPLHRLYVLPTVIWRYLPVLFINTFPLLQFLFYFDITYFNITKKQVQGRSGRWVGKGRDVGKSNILDNVRIITCRKARHLRVSDRYRQVAVPDLRSAHLVPAA